MSEKKEKQETVYPLRSLHDFLYELDKEWGDSFSSSLVGFIPAYAGCAERESRFCGDIHDCDCWRFGIHCLCSACAASFLQKMGTQNRASPTHGREATQRGTRKRQLSSKLGVNLLLEDTLMFV